MRRESDPLPAVAAAITAAPIASAIAIPRVPKKLLRDALRSMRHWLPDGRQTVQAALRS